MFGADVHRSAGQGVAEAAASIVAGAAELGRVARAGSPGPPASGDRGGSPAPHRSVSTSSTAPSPSAWDACTPSRAARSWTPSTAPRRGWSTSTPGERATRNGRRCTTPVKAIVYRQPYTDAFWHGARRSPGRHRPPGVPRRRPSAWCSTATTRCGAAWSARTASAASSSARPSPAAAFQEFQRVLQVLEGPRRPARGRQQEQPRGRRSTSSRSHDDMVLAADDIAVWRVNWAPEVAEPRARSRRAEHRRSTLWCLSTTAHYELAEVATRSCRRCGASRSRRSSRSSRSCCPAAACSGNLRVSAEDLERTEMIRSEQARAPRGSSDEPGGVPRLARSSTSTTSRSPTSTSLAWRS